MDVVGLVVNPTPHGRRKEVESPGYEFKKVADSATADYGVVAQFVGEECDAREAMADHQGTEKPNQPVL